MIGLLLWQMCAYDKVQTWSFARRVEVSCTEDSTSPRTSLMLLCTFKVNKDLITFFPSLLFVAPYLYLNNANRAENTPKIHTPLCTQCYHWREDERARHCRVISHVMQWHCLNTTKVRMHQKEATGLILKSLLSLNKVPLPHFSPQKEKTKPKINPG